jgi:hypothetical protein
MIQDWGACYRRLDRPAGESDLVEVWISPGVADRWWDDFLRGNPCGQFQQSSLWAQYKAGEGWSHHRVVLTIAGALAGGFQLLWKKTRFGRVGYVSKGPVAHPETAAVMQLLEKQLAAAATVLGLTAVIVQRPDESRLPAQPDREIGFVPSNPMGIIEATYLVDVRPEIEVLRSRMSASLRRNIRKARKQPLVVREGNHADIPRFFELMAATCTRQRTPPNPPSEEAIRRLWHIFHQAGAIRLTLAESPGGIPAAKLSLLFGDRMTLWKKGWDGSQGDWHPNELLEDEALEWAHARGFRICDFCSLGRATALRLLSGEPVTGEILGTRDEYHLRFGGFPQLLPPAHLLVPNPVLRWGYRVSYAPFERARNRRLALLSPAHVAPR